MKILYVSQYYPPEMGAPAARAAELARHWSEAGHEASVLTGFPNHPTGVVPPEWRSRMWRLACHERDGNVDVFRTWLWALPNRKAHERMRNYASFFVSAGIRGLALKRPDVIIGTSPQLLVALAAWWLASAKRVPFFFEVRDLWPESLTAVGVGDENSLLHTSLASIAAFLYKHSDHIVVVTPAFKDHLIHKWKVPGEKISIVENGVETDLFTPSDTKSQADVRAQIGAEGKFLVCYAGTMGMAHGLETLLQAATSLKQRWPDVLFLLVGEGAEKERVKQIAQSGGLTNVRFVDQQPREKIPGFISASDACLVLLKKTEVFKTVIPTKMLEFMSCARPIILAVEGQARQVLEEAHAGIAIEPENSVALASAVTKLADDPLLRQQLGRSGRDYVVQRLSRIRTAEKYIEVLESRLGLRRIRKAETLA